MENKTEKEKSCESCRYYFLHYFMWKERYRKSGCGHCVKYNTRKKRPPHGCELWEDISSQKEERKKSIEEALIKMSTSLSEISLILKEDK